MKKINRREFIRMSAVLAAAGALTACGGSKSGSTAGAGASAEGVKGLTLKLSHNANEQHLIHKAMTQFANEVNEKTNGDIKIEVYPNATLGGEKDNLEQMGIGALDMAKVSAASLETFAPVYEAFSVLYLQQPRSLLRLHGQRSGQGSFPLHRSSGLHRSDLAGFRHALLLHRQDPGYDPG